MIVFLEGNLFRRDTDSIVLLAGGIGYQVHLTRSTIEALPGEGETVRLHIHMVVREDAQLLFGFLSETEKTLFLKLIQVSSIGPKLALNILSGIPANELAEAIHHEDLVRLTAIPGIGKKTAERLVVDLKDKIIEMIGSTASAVPQPVKGNHTPSEEALSALVNLGYSRMEASQALKKVPEATGLSLEELVREGLKVLS